MHAFQRASSGTPPAPPRSKRGGANWCDALVLVRIGLVLAAGNKRHAIAAECTDDDERHKHTEVRRCTSGVVHWVGRRTVWYNIITDEDEDPNERRRRCIELAYHYWRWMGAVSVSRRRRWWTIERLLCIRGTRFLRNAKCFLLLG